MPVKVNALWGSKQLKLRKSKSRFCQPSHQSEWGTAHCLTLQHSVLSCSVRTEVLLSLCRRHSCY